MAEGENLHRWPQALKSGRAVLFTAAANNGSFGEASLVIQTIPQGARKVVLRGGYFGRYLASGHLVYMHDSTLFAVPFDIERLEVIGERFPVIEGVAASAGTGGTQLAVSSRGTLAYLAGAFELQESPIVWMDSKGQTNPLRAMPSNWSNPQFSPDGSRLAVDIGSGPNIDVWTYDWARDTLTRLTFGGQNIKPVWTPDGKRIVFSSTRDTKSVANLYWQRADGGGDAQRLTESTNNQFAASWHPDGKVLAFHEQTPAGVDLMTVAVDGNESAGWKAEKPKAFLSTQFTEQEPMFSPDGRWISYFANDTGQANVFVRPFPGPGGLQQISTAGGAYPMWSRTRPELFFQSAFNNSAIMVASYTAAGDSFQADKPRLWSPGRVAGRPRLRGIAIHPDGQRFAIAALRAPDERANENKLVFVFNFFDELKRLAPSTR
jgi:serine/threonine-protein kinase